MRNTARRQLGGILALTCAAVIWGMSFVTQKQGMKYLSPLAFNSFRFTFGFLSMLPLLAMPSSRTRPQSWRKTLWYCFASGGLLALAIALEQYGVSLSSNVGRAGFITALYIILVPFIGMFFGHRPHARVFVAAGLSLVGLALLTIDPKKGMGGSLGIGDLLLLLGAIGFALQMIVVDRSTVNPIHLSVGQLLVAALLSWAGTLILHEVPSFEAFRSAMWAVLYSGVCSTGIAYSLQVFGQQRIEAAPASILMSLESLFSAVGGAIFLGERMSIPALIGCGLMLTGTIVSQIPSRAERNVPEEYVEHEQ